MDELISRSIKLVIDTAIHGYALHTAYECSLHLLGVIWSSLTHLLLHLARGPTNKKNSTDNEDSRNPSAANIPKTPGEILSNPNTSVNTNSLLIFRINSSDNKGNSFLNKREVVTSKSQRNFLYFL